MALNMQDSLFGTVLGNFTAFAAGATVVYPSDEWNPSETLKSLQQEQCSALFARGSEVEQLIDHKEFTKFKFDALKSIVVGTLV